MCDDENDVVGFGENGHRAVAGCQKSVASHPRLWLHHRANHFGDGDIRGGQPIPQIRRSRDAGIHIFHRQPGVGERGLHREVNHLGDCDAGFWIVVRPSNAQNVYRLHFLLDSDKI